MRRRPPTDTPEAEFLRTQYGRAIIRCPLCGEEHDHEYVPSNRRQWRAAGCRLYTPVNRDQRANGYTFYVPESRTS